MEQIKKCTRCFEVKSVTEFYRRSLSKDGYRSECKLCGKLYHKQYYQKNKDQIITQHKQHREENKDKIKDYSRNYYRNRLSNDIQFKIAHNLRNRIYFALKGQAKSESTKQLLGTDFDIFIKWLVYQLPPDYTIEDIGKELHVDHVIPLSSFDLTDPEQLHKAMHWTNHQPLEASKNLSKGGKVDPWLAVCQDVKAKHFLKHMNDHNYQLTT